VNVKLLAQKIVRSVRDDGVQRSLRKAPQYLRRLRADVDDFDARHGTDTGGLSTSGSSTFSLRTLASARITAPRANAISSRRSRPFPRI